MLKSIEVFTQPLSLIFLVYYCTLYLCTALFTKLLLRLLSTIFDCKQQKNIQIAMSKVFFRDEKTRKLT